MTKRLLLAAVQPGATKAMGALDAYVATSGMNPLYLEIIRIRASQINGCAYCVNKHTGDARRLGETEQRIYLISVWHEAANVFTEEEQLIVAMTEEITLVHQHGLNNELYDKAIQLFGEVKTAQILMAIITINAWNRLGVGLKIQPVIRELQQA